MITSSVWTGNFQHNILIYYRYIWFCGWVVVGCIRSHFGPGHEAQRVPWYALSVVFASVGSCVGPPKHRLEETGFWLAGQRPLIILQSFHFMIVKATVHLNCSRFVDEVVVDAMPMWVMEVVVVGTTNSNRNILHTQASVVSCWTTRLGHCCPLEPVSMFAIFSAARVRPRKYEEKLSILLPCPHIM